MLFEREIPVLYQAELIVAGGGVTGVAAAVAAARRGVKTLLLERGGALGGVATAGLCNILLGGRRCLPEKGARKVRCVGGIFEEISDRLIRNGGAVDPDAIPQEGNPHGWSHGSCADGLVVDNEALKRLLDELCCESGVRVLYFTEIVGAERDGNRIASLVCHNKSGLFAAAARTVIDCTGDAEVAMAAGVPTELGRNNSGATAPTSVLMLVEGVEREKIFAYLEPDWYGRFRFRGLIRELREQGIWNWPYEIFISMQLVRPDVFLINTVRQVGVNGVDGESLSEAMRSGRAECAALFEVMRRHIPGFANASIRQIADIVGVRETRRIKGDFVLTAAALEGDDDFPDTITYSGYGAWDLPDPNRPSHQPRENRKLREFIPIPYRVMVPPAIENLLVAGRSISVERDVLGPLRVMAPCAGMGQAAGTAAALVLETGRTFADIDISELRRRLREAGAVVSI